MLNEVIIMETVLERRRMSRPRREYPLLDDLPGYEPSYIYKLEAKTDELKEQIREVKTEVRINAVKIEDMQTSMNWHFATFAIVVAIVGFTITLAPMFRDMFKDKNKYTTSDDVRGIVRDELNKLKSDPS